MENTTPTPTPNPVMKVVEPGASSQVREHGYCKLTNTLRVIFKGGGTYDYHKVPAELYEEMCKEGVSLGKFIGSKIKEIYGFTKHTKQAKEAPADE